MGRRAKYRILEAERAGKAERSRLKRKRIKELLGPHTNPDAVRTRSGTARDAFLQELREGVGQAKARDGQLKCLEDGELIESPGNFKRCFIVNITALQVHPDREETRRATSVGGSGRIDHSDQCLVSGGY